MKAAVLNYLESDNLGDYIQSIAAEKLIGKPTVGVDRDSLKSYEGEKVKLCMNGWFMEVPKQWPPSEKIVPFFTSFHINPTVEKQILNEKNISYLKKYEPIGCRDFYTKNRLEEKGVQSYFSGCLTLTLKKQHFLKKNQGTSGVLVLSVLERLLDQHPLQELLKGNSVMKNTLLLIKYPFRRIQAFKAEKRLKAFLKRAPVSVRLGSQIVDTSKHSVSERKALAQQQLECIAKASYVITSRIHTALPAVAMGVPVLFLKDGLHHINQKSRLMGLDSFFMSVTTKELKNLGWKDIQNPNTHNSYAKEMEEKVRAFFEAV